MSFDTLFELDRAHMLELPAVAPDLGTWHRVTVHRDCHVAHERALYSVPFTLVGKTRQTGGLTYAPPTRRCSSTTSISWWPRTGVRSARVSA